MQGDGTTPANADWLFLPAADKFFDHVWGGSQPGDGGSGSGSGAVADGQREAAQQEGSDDDAGEEARAANKPRPAPLRLTAPSGELLLSAWFVRCAARKARESSLHCWLAANHH